MRKEKILSVLVLFLLCAFAPREDKIRIFLIGDSTMAEIGYTSQDFQGYPRGGWGMGFQPFFNKDEVEIHNYALAGRRTDTYYSEAKGWETVLPMLGPGDVLFIQFGHNEVYDAYGSYTDYLNKFCDEAIAKGAQPVLLTPINRCSFNDDGTMYNTLGDYPDATRQLAEARDDVPLIDLHLRTKNRFEELGEEYTRWNIYSNIKPGIYPTWPNGRTDGTHLLLEGAWEISNMAREAILEKQDVPIFQQLAPSLNRAGIVWVLPEPNMSGYFSTWGTCIFPEGTEIEIVPTPMEDLPFSAWKKDGIVVSNAPTYTYTVSYTKFELTGYFGEDLYDCNGDLGGDAFIDECGECVGGNTGKVACIPAYYNLTTSINGQGSVTPTSGEYREDTEISLTATGTLGWAFDNWSGDASGTDNPLRIIMDADKSITANFVEVPTYNLTSTVPGGNGSISPTSGTYSQGDVVTLTATADAGYAFESWGGDAIGSSNPYLLTMDANKSVTANFIESPVPPALISLGFNETEGSEVSNAGTLSATFTKTDPPVWAANVPVNGGLNSVDFGTSTGNYYVESGSIIDGLAGLESFTVTGWVNNCNSTTGSGGNRIVSWINNGGEGVDIVYISDGSLKVGINQWPDRSVAVSSTGMIPTSSSAPATNWRFFAVTYDASLSTGHLCFYFGDNNIAASLDKTLSYDQGTVGTNIGKLAIGHFNAESSRSSRTDRMFRGLIDEVNIFGNVLTLAEIQAAQNIGTVTRVEVTGISIEPITASVNVGSTLQLTANLEPNNATNQNISWSSSNTAIATVNSSGLVSGVAEGSTTITVTTEEGGFTATCEVTTTNLDAINICAVGNSITQANDAHLSYRYPLWKKLIDSGIAFDLVGSMNSNYGGNPDWPDYNGQSFDSDHEGHWGWRANEIRDEIQGWLTGYTPDMVLLHIGTNDCYHDKQDADGILSEITQIIEYLRNDNPNVVVFLASLIPCKNVQSYIDALNAKIPGYVEDLNTEASPIIFVDMASIVTSDDLYDGIHPGPTGEEKMAQQWIDAIISYTSKKIPVTDISVAPTSATVNIGSTVQLSETVSPSDATNKNVTWSSSNTAIATVSSTGLVTGVAEGSATITVTSQDGSYTASSTITVNNVVVPVTGVSVSPTSASVNVGSTIQLSETITPSNATNKNVTWSSSNTAIATVSAAGLVTGVAEGSTTITVTTQDGAYTALSAIDVTQASEITLTIQENEDGFCSVDGSVDNNNAGFTGAGFANTDNSLNNGITWSVNVPSAGSYAIQWRYANGGSTDRTAQLMEDGTTIVSGISMPTTNSWTTWAESSVVNTDLSAGNKLIRLQATTSSGLANIDYIQITGNGISPVACSGLKSASISGNSTNVNIYPNPTKGHLNFEFDNELSEKVTICLHDLAGKPVKTMKVSEESCSMDISNLVGGLYIVKISGSNLNIVETITKE